MADAHEPVALIQAGSDRQPQLERVTANRDSSLIFENEKLRAILRPSS
jgi:hypothetical protein